MFRYCLQLVYLPFLRGIMRHTHSISSILVPFVSSDDFVCGIGIVLVDVRSNSTAAWKATVRRPHLR